MDGGNDRSTAEGKAADKPAKAKAKKKAAPQPPLVRCVIIRRKRLEKGDHMGTESGRTWIRRSNTTRSAMVEFHYEARASTVSLFFV